jgi:hypothetical protein
VIDAVAADQSDALPVLVGHHQPATDLLLVDPAVAAKVLADDLWLGGSYSGTGGLPTDCAPVASLASSTTLAQGLCDTDQFIYNLRDCQSARVDDGEAQRGLPPEVGRPAFHPIGCQLRLGSWTAESCRRTSGVQSRSIISAIATARA